MKLRIQSIKKYSFFFIIFTFFMPSLVLSAKIPNVIVFETMDLTILNQRTQGLLDEFKAKGYIDKQNINLIMLNAHKDKVRGEKILRDALSKYDVDLVMTNATMATQITKKVLKGTQIPQIFFGVSNPVKAGIVPSLEKKGDLLITGVSHDLPRNTVVGLAKKVLLSGDYEKPLKIGVIYSKYPSETDGYNSLKEYQEQNKDIVFKPIFIDILSLKTGAPKMLEQTFSKINQLKDEIDFIWMVQGPLVLLEKYTEPLIEKSSVPISFVGSKESVQKGALLSISTDPFKDGADSVEMAIRVLNNEDIRNINIHRSKDISLSINIKTAIQMKLVVPSDILDLAKENLFFK